MRALARFRNARLPRGLALSLGIVIGLSGGLTAADLLSEGFDRTEPGNLPPHWTVAAGSWKVESGELVGASPEGTARIELPGTGRTGFRLELRFAFLDGGRAAWCGVEFGAAGEAETIHLLRIRRDAARRDGIAHGVRGPGGRFEVRDGGAGPELAAGSRHSLRLESGGGRVRGAIDGELVADSFIAHDVRPGPIRLAVASGRAAFDAIELRPLTKDELDRLRVELGPLRRVPVVAHRGASANAPENTLSALRLALERGADAVEFDVYRTLDGELVLLHDPSVLRTTDFRSVFPEREEEGSKVAALSLEDLRRLDAGSWKSPRYAGERIPTLREALELLRGRATPVIEIKPDAIGPDVAAVIRRLALEGEVFVQSFSERALREFRDELPSVPTGFLTGERVSVDAALRAREHLRRARTAGASAVVVDHTLASPEYLREMHRHAMTVWVYTVDDPALMELLVRAGAGGIITDVPGRARRLLESVKQPSNPGVRSERPERRHRG